MPKINKHNWVNYLFFVLLSAIPPSFFISRALLSIIIIAVIACSIFHRNITTQIKTYLDTPLLWGISLLFLIPLISGFWSEDLHEWASSTRIKIPLLLLPFAFASPLSPGVKQWKIISGIFIFTVFIGSLWTFVQFIQNRVYVEEAYLRAQSMLTPLENDHVRFSFMVYLALLLSIWGCWRERINRHFTFWILVVISAWFILFLHLLAARTGLISFYISCLIAAIYFLIFQRNWIKTSIIIVLIICLPLLAYYFIPSFQNRVRFIQYDYGYFSKAHYLPGATDAIRVISLNAGARIMNDRPFSGVGFGDIKAATRNYYEREYPLMREGEKILPSSQFLIYGSGSGWPGFLIYTFIMVMPLFVRNRYRLAWTLLIITTAFSLCFDIGLEVQFGVILYCLPLLALWKAGRIPTLDPDHQTKESPVKHR